MANFFKKWWPSIAPIVGMVWTIFSPTLQGYVSTHPAVAGVVGGAYAVAAHLMTSPLGPPPPPTSGTNPYAAQLGQKQG